MVRKSNSWRSSESSSINRRTFLKASSGAVVGVSAAGLAGADEEEGRVEGEVPYPDRGTLRVDESVKSITPQYYLLTLGRDRVLDLIDKSEKDGRRQTELRDFLKDAWRNYQVQRVQDGEDVVISLANDRANGRKTVDDEDEQFNAAARAVRRGYAEESSDVTTQWTQTPHKKITEEMCQEFDLYDFQVSDIVEASPEPDSDPCDGCSADMFPGSWAMPSWVKDKIEQGLNKIAHHYGHYYDPNTHSYTMAGVGIEYDGIGAAPQFCEYAMGQANQNSYSTERRYVGRALHYVQDMSVPLHTGMGREQIGLYLDCDWSGCAGLSPHRDEHEGYESYVFRNFTSGENFADEMGSFWVYSSNPDWVVERLASRTNDYSYEVFHLMVDNGPNPDNWSSWSDRNDLDELTANCISWAGGYSHAILNQMYDK